MGTFHAIAWVGMFAISLGISIWHAYTFRPSSLRKPGSESYYLTPLMVYPWAVLILTALWLFDHFLGRHGH